jgi:hypothetical protein
MDMMVKKVCRKAWGDCPVRTSASRAQGKLRGRRMSVNHICGQEVLIAAADAGNYNKRTKACAGHRCAYCTK